ncbi:hypothetical protein FQZ97_1030110 [compost metagenome]
MNMAEILCVSLGVSHYGVSVWVIQAYLLTRLIATLIRGASGIPVMTRGNPRIATGMTSNFYQRPYSCRGHVGRLGLVIF